MSALTPDEHPANALREYHTGAASDGAAQSDQALCLGGHRASNEVICFEQLIGSTAGPIALASGLNGIGDGMLIVTGESSLSWIAPGELTAGPPVKFTGTQTLVLEASSDEGKYVRVTATPPFDVSAKVTLLTKYNNVYAMTDRPAGGGTQTVYRGVMLKNVTTGSLTSVKRWIHPLGTSRVSSGAQLGGSGAGTITVAGDISDWPVRGWCQVRQSGGTLREVVYYRKRSGSTLTVPSYGRARLGTSAGAGSASDVITPVPGIAIAAGAVLNSGVAGATIANATTEPTSITWSLTITEATAISYGTLTSGQQAILWLKREIHADTPATPACTVAVAGSFSGQSMLSLGSYRIARNAGYALYVGEDEVPDVNDDPASFSETLPITLAVTPPVSGTKAVNALVRWRNTYGLESQNSSPETFLIDSAGDEQYPLLSAPSGLGLFLQESGKLKVNADYPGYGIDSYQANKWRVWYGLTEPDPDSDTPSAEVSINYGRLSFTTLTALLADSTYHVKVVVYRTLDGSRSEALSGTVHTPPVPPAPSSV